MIKFVLSAAAVFGVASLAALPAAAYTLPERLISPPSGSFGKSLIINEPAFAIGIAPSLAPGTLLVNGSFETGDFTGWTQVNDTSFTGIAGEFGGILPTDGDLQAFFGPVDPGGGGIIQAVATNPGAIYTLTFDLANFGGVPNGFGLFWDGGFVSIDFDLAAFDYTTFTTSLTASGASTDLGFIFYHEPSYFLLDNVSLTGAIPEPQSWAMLIAGFGLTGAAMRRRRIVVAA